MKIYTKTGDKGSTKLIGGKNVKKHNIKCERMKILQNVIRWINYETIDLFIYLNYFKYRPLN